MYISKINLAIATKSTILLNLYCYFIFYFFTYYYFAILYNNEAIKYLKKKKTPATISDKIFAATQHI